MRIAALAAHTLEAIPEFDYGGGILAIAPGIDPLFAGFAGGLTPGHGVIFPFLSAVNPPDG
jgi:hypothetical protein